MNSNRPYHDNTIAIFLVGSRAYGLNSLGSDYDYKCLSVNPPSERLATTHRPFEVMESSRTKTQIFEWQHFMRLISKGNPTLLELLFAPVVDSGESRILKSVMDGIIEDLPHKGILRSYLGYMRDQKDRLMGRRGQKDVNRQYLTTQYGFDTKYAMHAARLGLQGLEYARERRIQLPIATGQQLLLDIRHGKYTLPQVEELLNSLESDLNSEITKSDLPEHPPNLWIYTQAILDARTSLQLPLCRIEQYI